MRFFGTNMNRNWRIACPLFSLIEYDGTIEQWNEIEKADNWDNEFNAVIKCTDGNITI